MLEFDAVRHEYALDGKKIPSVTSIISAVGLYDYDYVARDTLRTAAERGTVIHKCCELYELGMLDETSIDPELRGYWQAYRQAKTDKALPERADEVEKMIASKRYGYAGTLDQIYGEDWVNDVKTGMPGAEHGLQLSAYWLAMHDDDIRARPRKLTCTYLRPDGAYSVREYDYDPLTWLAVLTDYKWRVAHNKIKARWM